MPVFDYLKGSIYVGTIGRLFFNPARKTRSAGECFSFAGGRAHSDRALRPSSNECGKHNRKHRRTCWHSENTGGHLSVHTYMVGARVYCRHIASDIFYVHRSLVKSNGQTHSALFGLTQLGKAQLPRSVVTDLAFS